MHQLQLSIPEPCHQEWNNMTPNDQGRFCNSCAKTVVDFSAMTDAQLIFYFENLKNENICGRVHADQLDRTIKSQPEPRKKIVGYWQYLLAFFIMLGKGQQSKAQGNIKGEMVARPDTIKKTVETHIRLGGIRKLPPPKNTKAIGAALPFYFITDERDQPIANASVQMLPKGDWLTSDSSGKINLGQDHKVESLVVSSVGFEGRTILLKTLDGNAVKLSRVKKLLEDVRIECEASIRRVAGRMCSVRTEIFHTSLKDSIADIFTINPDIQLFPNPVAKGSSLSINTHSAKTGKYTLQVTDALGKVLLQHNYAAPAKNMVQQITVPATWNAGIYFVTLINEQNKKLTTGKLLIE